jgi:hypothetical protein
MKTIFSLFLFFVVTISVNAQSTSTPNRAQRAGEAIFFEKTGLTTSDLKQISKHPEKAKEIISRAKGNETARSGNPAVAASNEVIVSGSTDVESEIHAAMNPTDTMNLVCSPNAQTGGLTNPIYYSTNFGTSWNAATFNNDPHITGGFTLGGGDPMFAYDNAGKIYYSWIRLFFANSKVYAAMYWASSVDAGATWQRAANDRVAIDSSASIVSLPDKFFDKQWMAVDHSNSPYQNDLYCALFQTQTSTNGLNIVVYKKPAASNAFNAAPGIVSDNSFVSVQFSDIVVDNNGNVHVSFFGSQDSINYAFYHSVSTDGGQTFSTPNKISDAHVPGFSADQPTANFVGIDPQRFYPCTHIAVDNSTGANANNLYAVWTANGLTTPLTTGLDVFYSRSTDGGNTWSAAIHVNDDTASAADNFYPAITVNSDGILFISWYDRRTDPVNNKTTNYYFAYSTDGGATLLGNQQITNQPTDFSTIGSQNSAFGIGEYTQIVAARGFAIPVWTDGRTNNGDLNIYCATIPWATYSGISDPVMINKHHIGNSFPNPSNGELNFTLTFDKPTTATLELFDLQGRMVMTLLNGKINSGETKMKIDVSSLASGNYLLVLKTDEGKETSKVTVAH